MQITNCRILSLKRFSDIAINFGPFDGNKIAVCHFPVIIFSNIIYAEISSFCAISIYHWSE